MANNTVLNPGALGDTIATLDILGVKHELVINEFSDGAGGATKVSASTPLPVTDNAAEVSLASIDAKLTNPLPVSISSDIQIGAVELKNATTDDRVSVINIAPTTEFGVVTRNIPSGTQPVSAASLPLPSGAATAANQQTNALTDTQLRATPVPVSGTVTATATDLDIRNLSQAQDAVLIYGSDDGGTTKRVIKTDIGGAIQVDLEVASVTVTSSVLPTGASTLAEQQTQTTALQLIDDTVYTDGTGTVIKGIAILGQDGTNPQAIKTDAAGELQVDVLTIPAITGTVTANAGTNLNTSLLALEAGGNLATIKTNTDKIPAQGQALAAASTPVVLTAAQITTLTPQTNALTDAQLRATAVPVSGTVTANAGTNLNTSALALSATQTDGTQKAIARGGAKGATTAADITSTSQSVDRNAMDVQIRTSTGAVVDAFSGGTEYTEDAVAAADPIGGVNILVRKDAPAAITSLDGDNVAQRGTNYGAAYSQIVTSAGAFVDTFGGGQQYADAAARGTATGTLAMGDDGTNIQAVKVDAAGELQVDVLTLPALPAGTNNIGDVDVLTLPALVAGTANIGDVDVLTVNGVAPAFGTGARGATVQRVTIATDDSVPVTGPLTDAQLRATAVPVSGTVAVTGVSTLAEQQTQTTALQLIDDTVYASDAALNKTMGIAAVLDDVATVAITENQAGYVRMSARRALLVEGVASGTALNVLDTNSAAALTALQLLDNAISGAGFNITQQGGVAVSLNTGVRDAGTQRVTIATNDAVPVTFTGSTDAATQTTLASVLTGVQLIDDTVKTLGTDTYLEGTTKGLAIGAIRRDANTTAASLDNEIAPLQVNATGDLKVAQILPLPAGNNNIGDVDIVSGTITTVSTVTNISQQGGVAISLNTGVRDTGTQRVTIATNDLVPVSLAAETTKVIGTVNIAAAQTLATVTTVASVTQNPDIRQATAANLNAQVVGNIAHDGVDSGNPVGVAYRAISHGTNPTAVAAADRTVGYSNIAGIPFVMGGHPNIISAEYYTTGAQTDDNILPAIAGGTIYVITSISVIASAANTVNTSVRIGFGLTTVPAQGISGADAVSKVILSHPNIPAGSGLTKGTGAGIVGIGGDAEELRITCSVPTTGSLIVQVDYYTITS